MNMTFRVAAVLLSLSAIGQPAVAAEKPSDLIVGKWRDRAERDDAEIEFLKDGTGTITAKSAEQSSVAPISWKVKRTYGNACIVVVKYEQPKSKKAAPLPKEAKPFTWLIVFDGADTFLMQPRQNDVAFMDRQEP